MSLQSCCISNLSMSFLPYYSLVHGHFASSKLSDMHYLYHRGMTFNGKLTADVEMSVMKGLLSEYLEHVHRCASRCYEMEATGSKQRSLALRKSIHFVFTSCMQHLVEYLYWQELFFIPLPYFSCIVYLKCTPWC